MNEPTAEIEPAKVPGNYSARKNFRWNAGTHKPGAQIDDSDAIHQNVPKTYVSPAQMYSTDSGQMFHAGSICIVLVGLPGRGKTNLSIGLCRYLRWLGVRTQLFHLSDYRRKRSHHLVEVLADNKEAVDMMKEITKEAYDDMVSYFKRDDGQIAIYDAINGSAHQRELLAENMKKLNVKCLFIESLVDDDDLLSENVKDAINSPDYKGWGRAEALMDFRKKIAYSEGTYQTFGESQLSYIRSFNFGQRIIINQLKHDFLMTKIIFYILNTKIKSHSIYFARCSLNTINFKEDPPITEAAQTFIKKIYNTICSEYEGGNLPNDMVVWTSTRLRTQQSAQIFKDTGLVVKHRPELTQLNPGSAEGLSDFQLQQKYPEDFERHSLDPYHHRYPRAESYHDLALKIEPLILEMEKLNNDVLIIADETITRIFYGYLMASNAQDIPYIRFPKNEIVKISYHAYGNTAKRLTVEGFQLDQV